MEMFIVYSSVTSSRKSIYSTSASTRPDGADYMKEEGTSSEESLVQIQSNKRHSWRFFLPSVSPGHPIHRPLPEIGAC